MSCNEYKKRPARDHRAGLMLFQPASTTTSTCNLTIMATPRVRTSPTSRRAAIWIAALAALTLGAAP